MKKLILVVLFAILLAACGAKPASEDDILEVISEASLAAGDTLPAPTGEVILTIEGAVTNTNGDGVAEFDLAMLESLGLVQYDVTDPFAERVIVYTGPLFRNLMEVVGVSSEATTVELVALNDYSAEMQIGDAYTWPVLFALQADGEYIPLDGGGPAIIVFPYDDYPNLDVQLYNNLWVWSMTRIVVK